MSNLLFCIFCDGYTFMYINATIIPNAKKPSVIALGENNYKIRVDAPALNGLANMRLVEILSEYFNVKSSKISIIKGTHGRKKYIYIESI